MRSPGFAPAHCVAWAMCWACVHLPTCEQDGRYSEPTMRPQEERNHAAKCRLHTHELPQSQPTGPPHASRVPAFCQAGGPSEVHAVCVCL